MVASKIITNIIIAGLSQAFYAEAAVVLLQASVRYQQNLAQFDSARLAHEYYLEKMQYFVQVVFFFIHTHILSTLANIDCIRLMNIAFKLFN